MTAHELAKYLREQPDLDVKVGDEVVVGVFYREDGSVGLETQPTTREPGSVSV